MRENRITSDVTVRCINNLGVFADWSMPSRRELEVAARTFNVVILGVLPKEPFKRIDVWEPTISPARVRETGIMAMQMGFRVVVMAWMGRGEKQIRAACAYVKQAVKSISTECRGLLDCEKTYDTGVGVHPLPYDVADDLVASELQGIDWGVTGISPNVDDSLIPLLKVAPFRVPQAYSIFKPKKPGEDHWSHSPSTFPGVMQRRAFDHWSAVADLDPEKPARVIMGLANYWGARPASALTPAITHEQMLRFSCAEVASLPGVDEEWFWSLKWHLDDSPAAFDTRRFFGETRPGKPEEWDFRF